MSHHELRRLDADEIERGLTTVPAWRLRGNAIERELEFAGFEQAMEFANRVALVAQERDHHPDIYISYKRVRLTLTTHKAGGLTAEDFELADTLDRLVEAD